MSVTTGQQLKDLGGGLFSAVSSTEKTRVQQALVKRVITVPWSMVAVAAGADSTQYIWTCPSSLVNGVRILSASWLAPATLAAEATNYITLTLYNGSDSVGAITSVNAMTAGAPRAFTVSTTYNNVAAGGVLKLTKTYAASGTALVSGGILTLEVEEL